MISNRVFFGFKIQLFNDSGIKGVDFFSATIMMYDLDCQPYFRWFNSGNPLAESLMFQLFGGVNEVKSYHASLCIGKYIVRLVDWIDRNLTTFQKYQTQI